jgi:hypothetical protein
MCISHADGVLSSLDAVSYRTANYRNLFQRNADLEERFAESCRGLEYARFGRTFLCFMSCKMTEVAVAILKAPMSKPKGLRENDSGGRRLGSLMRRVK